MYRITITGLDLDAAWQNIICTLGDFSVESDKSQAQIDRLDRQMRAERQPRRKNELFKQIQKLKSLLWVYQL